MSDTPREIRINCRICGDTKQVANSLKEGKRLHEKYHDDKVKQNLIDMGEVGDFGSEKLANFTHGKEHNA
jgi:hypothetical protein